MKRALKKRRGPLAGLAAVVAMYGALLAYPEPLFASSVTCSDITFYSQAPLPPQTADIAAEVALRLKTSELNSGSTRQRVFVVGRPWLWTLLNGPYRGVMARNVELTNAILVPTLDFQHRLIRRFDGRAAGAVGILTHEAVHTLVQRHIGLLRVWRLAWWQREGYPEYIASQKCTASEAPPRYRRAALAWKSLLESEHLRFDQVIALRTPLAELSNTRKAPGSPQARPN